jgi:hypothetical protein
MHFFFLVVGCGGDAFLFLVGSETEKRRLWGDFWQV